MSNSQEIAEENKQQTLYMLTIPVVMTCYVESETWKCGTRCNSSVINSTDKAVTNDRLRMLGFQRPFPLHLLCLFQSHLIFWSLAGAMSVELITNLKLKPSNLHKTLLTEDDFWMISSFQIHLMSVELLPYLWKNVQWITTMQVLWKCIFLY